MNKQQAIDSLTSTLIDTDFLACVITYFDCTRGKSPTFAEISKFFKETAIPEAEQILYDKFKIIYRTLISIEESLFLTERETPFQ